MKPWRSAKSDAYHSNTECNTGNNIEVKHKRAGDGGKTLCQQCEELNKEGQ